MKTYWTLWLLVSFAAPALADTPYPWLTERKIQGANNLESIEKAAGTNAYNYSRVVARVERTDGMGFCTASRVAHDLFLTNYHCDLGCETIQFKMGYEKEITEEHQAKFKCKALVRKNLILDYALFRVELPERGEEAYPTLTLWNGPIEVNEKLLVASHPGGRLKEIDRSDECLLTTITPFVTDSGRNTIKHMCDTEGGSSGSPVLDRETGYAVALHWGGKDGEYNMAIPMKLIIADLQQHLETAVYESLTVVE